MSRSAAAPPGFNPVADSLAANRLGVPSVIFFVMSAATPLTVVAGVVTTGFAATGLVGLPTAFGCVGLILGLFGVGYVRMARQVGCAGAFYSYLARGLGRPVGVAGAWVALIAYNCLQIGLYGAIGAAAGPLLDQWFGINPPWWTVALIAWAITAVLGLLRVDLNGTVLAVLLVAEVAVIGVYSLASLAHPAGGHLTLDALSPANLAGPGAGAILVLAVLGFVGFESAVVFSEESRDPDKTVPRATYLSVTIIAILYTLAAWSMTVTVGPDRIVDASREQGTELIFTLAGTHLGSFAATLGHTLFVTSLIAAMISFHGTTSRYMYALGREAVLPRALGRTSVSTGSPRTASLVQSTLAFVVIVIYAIAGWNPTVTMFYWLGTTGGLGVLLLIAATSIAVIAFSARHPGREPFWRRLLVPLVAAMALGVVVVLAVSNIATLLGVPGDHPLTWIVPTGYLATALLGAAWGVVLKTSQPEVYARIGLGAKAAVATISLPADAPAAPAPRHGTQGAARPVHSEPPARPAYPEQPARPANRARGFGVEADR